MRIWIQNPRSVQTLDFASRPFLSHIYGNDESHSLLFLICNMMTFRILLSLILCATGVVALRVQLHRMAPQRGRWHLLGSYVPPELDPENRKVEKAQVDDSFVQRTSQPRQTNSTVYPAPREGDIVLFSGRWGERLLGRIRFLRFVDSEDGYFAEITPMKEGKSVDVFVVDKSAKTEFLRISALQPVRAEYRRSENGYKVRYTDETKQAFVLRSSQYHNVDRTFVPFRKAVDPNARKLGFQEYAALKSRVIGATLQLGAAAGTGLALSGLGGQVVGAYALGVLGSCAYFLLLSKKVDQLATDRGSNHLFAVGSLQPLEGESNTTLQKVGVAVKEGSKGELVGEEGGTGGIKASAKLQNATTTDPAQGDPSTASPTISHSNTATASVTELASQYALQRLTKLGANARLAVPVLLLMLLAAKDRYLDGAHPTRFHVVSQQEFLGAMGGFLTLRASLLGSEVLRQLRGRDLASLLPGSLGIALRGDLNSVAAPEKPRNDDQANRGSSSIDRRKDEKIT